MAAGRETDIPFEQATLTTFEGYVKKTKKKMQWLRHFPSLRGPIERIWNTELPVCWNSCFIRCESSPTDPTGRDLSIREDLDAAGPSTMKLGRMQP